MSNNEPVAIQRLIERQPASVLLQNYASSLAGLAFAIFRIDGKLFASTENWRKDLTSFRPEDLSALTDARAYQLDAKGNPTGTLVALGKSASKDNPLERAVQQSFNALLAQAYERRDMANEALERYREINLMYRVSETVGALLDVEKIPAKILEESQRVIRAQSGIVLLSPASGDANWAVKACYGRDEPGVLEQAVQAALGAAWQTDRPAILTDVPNPTLGAMLWAPLKGKTSVLGAIVIARGPSDIVFTASDQKLLMALASQAAVSVENARLHQQVLDKERLEHELQLARDVQASLIPSVTPEIPGWDFAAYWQPAREVSGDFYDFISGVGDKQSAAPQYGIVIGDVSDKGMHAALFMALTRSVVRASTTAGLAPSDGLTQTNRLLCADSTNGMFVTLFYTQLDTLKNELTYVNAGHNPPFHYRAKEQDLTELKSTGIMLGFTNTVTHKQRAVLIEPNDFIVFYTDGVTEAMNEQNEQFGEERLRDLLLSQREQTPRAMMIALQQSLLAFVGNRNQSDDITVVIAKRTGL